MEEGLTPRQPVNDAIVPYTEASVVSGRTEDAQGQGRLRRALRGRLWLAVLVGLACGTTAGVFAYRSVDPAYESVGLIEIRPYMPKIIFDTEESEIMPMFDQFVQSQVELAKSPRVLDQAMADVRWRQFDPDVSPEAQEHFRRSTGVSRRGRSNLLQFSFEHGNPDAAKQAVDAIMDAYLEIYGERDARNHEERQRKLELMQAELRDKMNSIRKMIRELADDYGSDSLESMYQAELEQLQKLKDTLRNTELEAIALGIQVNEEEGGEQVAAETESWAEKSAEEIALLDPEMHSLLQQRRLLDDELQVLKLNFGEGHPNVRAQLKQIEAKDAAIDRRAAQFRDMGPNTPGEGFLLAGANMQDRLQQLRSLCDGIREETLRIGRKNNAIKELKEELEHVKERLQQTKGRMEQLEVESAGAGRIAKIADASVLLVPTNQGKTKQLAVLAFLGGGGLGLAVVMGLCYRSRRLRDSVDAEHEIGRVRILGLLPYLPEDLDDPMNATNACYGVHHIRTLLQLSPDGADQRVFAVTGPEPNVGKTSLTLALGLSFASSGQETLLIDADIVGGGLTRRLNAIHRRRLGRILLQKGLVNEEQLSEALESAGRSGEPLGQTLVRMRVLTQNDLTDALDSQKSRSLGLLDSLNGDTLEACVMKTGIPNLSILPIGDAKVADVGRVTSRGVRRLIAEARERYANTLIDTGPVPADVCSGVFANAADQTVVVVSRGNQRDAAERSITYLRSIGAPLAGVVFNRAGARDIAHSRHCSASAWSGRSIRVEESTDVRTATQETTVASRRFDPITRAVASTSSLKAEEE